MSQAPCLYSGKQTKRLGESSGRVSLQKDILSCGIWEGGDCPRWEVTPDVIDRIVKNFRLAKSRGVRVPFVYEHENLAKDRVGDVEELWREDCRLMAIVSASTDEARKLETVQDEVSVGVTDNWKDGSGNVYDLALEHLAIVTNPVCHGQGPFRRLSLKGKTMSKRRLAEGDPPVPPGDTESAGPADDATEISVTEVVGMLKKYFEVELPSDVDTAKELRLVLETMMAGSTEDVEPPAEVIDTMPVDSMPMGMLRLSVKGLRKRNLALSGQVEATRKLAESRAKDEFVADLDEFVAAGAITEADKQTFLTDGAKVGYSKTMLLGLKKGAGQAYATGPGQRRLGTSGRVPAQTPLPVHGQRPSDEECKQAANSWLGRKS